MEKKLTKNEEEEEEIFYSPEKMEKKDEENGEKYKNDLEEKKKISNLRGIVEKQDPVCKYNDELSKESTCLLDNCIPLHISNHLNRDLPNKQDESSSSPSEVDDITLRRFLHARDLDVEKASAMFMKYSTWRRTFVPEGSIPPSEVPNQIQDNKVFMQGTDKRGCPILVILGAKHYPRKGGTDEFKRKYVPKRVSRFSSSQHTMWKIPDGQEKFVVIVDLKAYSYSNIDVRGYIAAISILQDYYPERLEKLLFVHASYLFMTAWKMIYPFIDKRIKKKMVFVENKKLQDTLLEEIDEDELPENFGGKLQLVPIQGG